MSPFVSLRAMLQGWIGEAATGLRWLADAPRTRRALRLAEGPQGRFRLERRGGRRGGETIADGIMIGDGALAPAPPATRAALRGAQLEIALLSQHFLVRPLELPAQAAPFLDGVVRTQIDRITPWRASEAAFGAAPPEALGGDRILARIVATPRARLTGYLETFAAFGVGALTISTEIESGGTPVRVAVLSQGLGDAGRLRNWSRTLTIALGAAGFAAAAAIGAWSYLGLSLDDERERLETAIASKRAALLAARRIAERDAMAELNQRKRAGLPTVLAIETLSKILPDGAHLTQLDLEPGKVTLAGVTDDAPGLIAIIEQSRQFANATFSAPTTRAANEAGERFRIVADVKPGWVAAP